MPTAVEIIIIALLIIAVVMLGIIIANQLRKSNDKENTERLENTIRAEQSSLRQELTSATQSSVKNLGDMLASNQNAYAVSQSKSLSQLEERLKTFSLENEQKLDNIRGSVENRLNYIQTDNNKKLEEVRKTVDTRLEQSVSSQSKSLSQLEERLKTFSLENEQKLDNIRCSVENRLNYIQTDNNKKLEEVRKTVDTRLEQSVSSQSKSLSQLEERLKTFSLENEQKLDNIRCSVENRLNYIQTDNNKKLEEMRKTVDERLQQSIEEKMNRSFSLVNERLEQVYKGLGEMQSLAVGVGDLKKVLTNVKTRGILGEIQLSAILGEILSPEQYDENVATKKGSRNVVEFAVKLPSDDDKFIYLPIDSKFPGDTYSALRDAIEEGDKAKIELAAKALIATIKSEAKDIHDKYIDPPYTTEFAIMFLPFEGLYSEVVNRGLVEVLQRDYKVNIAGPSTMAALLNSLQMGFKTLAVQKRSAEVWEILGAVKQEFDKFGDVLSATQQRLDQANKELDKLVGVRTRQIQRKLKDVQLPTKEIADKVFED